LLPQKNLWVKRCPDPGKTFASKGVTVFQPEDHFDTQNGIGFKGEGRIFGVPLMPQKTLAAAAAF
jgi:hypothetical protein